MYLGIFIVNIILYIFELIYKTIEKFNDYDSSFLYNTIIKSATATAIEKNSNILVPDKTTFKIFRSSFIN